MTILLTVLAILVILIGLVGTVVPGLPGAVLIFAGIVGLAWLDGFASLGLGLLVILALLTAATYIVDVAATAFGARQAGASRAAIVGAILGMLGGVAFGLPGIVVGPFVGALIGEYLHRRNLAHAARAGAGAWIGLLLGTAAKLALVLSMLAIAAFALLV